MCNNDVLSNQRHPPSLVERDRGVGSLNVRSRLSLEREEVCAERKKGREQDLVVVLCTLSVATQDEGRDAKK